MKEHKKNLKTKKGLLTHPLRAQLQTCSSPTGTDILAVLRTQVQQFEQSMQRGQIEKNG
jgi:hypothetical protein